MTDTNTRDTICRDCVFAKIGQTTGSFGNDREQFGCELGFLDKYKNKTEVVKESEGFDDGLFVSTFSYYRIKNRLCIGCRNKEWKDNLKISATEQIAKEIELPVTYIIYLDDNSVVEDVEKTVRSVNSLDRLPDLCIFIDNSSVHAVKLSMFNKILSQLKTKWKVSLNASPLSTIEKCIDSVANNITGLYFSVYSAGAAVYDTVELYYMLRENMEQIVMLTPDEYGEGLTVLTAAYFAFGQNTDYSIITKIKNQTETNKCQHMIKSVTVLMSQ